MSKVIQVRDVSESVYDILRSRASREGMSLSDLIRRELEHVVERPRMKEWLARTQRAKPISSSRNAVLVIREMRDQR